MLDASNALAEYQKAVMKVGKGIKEISEVTEGKDLGVITIVN